MDQIARLRLLAERNGWEEIDAQWKGSFFFITFRIPSAIGRDYTLTVSIREEIFTGAFFDTGLDLSPYFGLHSEISELFKDDPEDLIRERGISGHFGFALPRESMSVDTIDSFVDTAYTFSDRLFEAIARARAAVIGYRDELIKSRDPQNEDLIG